MRYTLALFIAATLLAQDKKPPDQLVFHTKAGDVTFTHANHITRQKGECATCHNALWPQSTVEPLKSSDGCRTCHRAGGVAFETKGACVKCHPTPSTP
jgi:c(7)-type cytochrome triheme protein